MTRTLGIGAAAALLLVTCAGAQPLAFGNFGAPQTPAPAQFPALPPAEQRVVDAQMADLRLDASVRIPSLKRETTSIRDVMSAIAGATGLTTRYDQNVPEVDKTCTVDLVDASLEDALKLVLHANAAAFKVLGPKAVFVYSDTPANRQKYTESIRTFYITNADPTQIGQLIIRLPAVSTPDGIRPVLVTGRASHTITVKATADKMAEIAKFIAANDKL